MSVGPAAALLRRYADITSRVGSPLTQRILEITADDLEAGGITRTLLRDELQATAESAMPLRVAAALHRLVLQGRAPSLAAFYPSVGGVFDADAIGPALRETVEAHRQELPALISRPCQTNEAGRSAGLIVGFLTIGGPLRLLEIGASAGLNLRWDRYRYESSADGRAWGPAGSPAVLRDRWTPAAPFLDGDARVIERAGCDPNPIDPASEEGSLSIRASVWADQLPRFELLEGALRVARDVPAEVDRARAGEWLAGRLQRLPAGATTVVYQSVVWQYIEAAEQAEIERLVRRAGEGATDDARLAWLRMEPEDLARRHRVELTTWPRGETRLLAKTRPHGEQVEVLGGR